MRYHSRARLLLELAVTLPLPEMDPCYLCEIVAQSASDWGLGPPHIARLENRDEPAHLDHASVTAGKLKTVEVLRRYFQ